MIWDRLVRYFLAMIDARMVRTKFLGRFAVIVVAQKDRSQFLGVDVRFESAPMAPIPDVPFSGARLVCSPGARLWLEFANGDPSAPRIVDFDTIVPGVTQVIEVYSRIQLSAQTIQPPISLNGPLAQTALRTGDALGFMVASLGGATGVTLQWTPSPGFLPDPLPPGAVVITAGATSAGTIIGNRPTL